MQDDNKENQTKSSKLLDLSPEDKRNLVGFFELLLKIDKRVNPDLPPPNKANL
jgi:hypothetical protein